MNNKSLPHLILGFSCALIAWGLQEVVLVFTHYDGFTPGIRAFISGAAVGGVFGFFFGIKEGFFTKNTNLMKRGASIGIVLGAISGILIFLIIQFTSQLLEGIFPPETVLFKLFIAQKWILFGLALGLVMGVRDHLGVMLTRGILSGAIGGIVSAILCFSTMLVLDNSFFIRGFSLVFFGVSLAYVFYYFSFYRKKAWFKTLNGIYEGFDFELYKEIHHIGSQSQDEINLKDYKDINSSHAKVIRYPTGYSLVDNDPLGRTFVNYRTVTEQPLKTGDIIKIGNALFQYCQTG